MPPEFFVDRSLGRIQIAAALRAAGWAVTTHHDVYAERDENVPDVEWLELCADRGLVVLSKDRRLRYKPDEIAVIRRRKLRVFVLSRGNLTASTQAQRFVDHAARIAAELRALGRSSASSTRLPLSASFPDSDAAPRRPAAGAFAQPVRLILCHTARNTPVPPQPRTPLAVRLVVYSENR